MKSHGRAVTSLWLLAGVLVAGMALAEDKEPAKPTIADVTKGAKVIDGLFSPYFNDAEQKLYFSLSKADLGPEFLAVSSIARGPSAGELTNNSVIVLRKVGQRVQVIQRQTDARADADSPAAGAVQTTYTDSVVAVMPVRLEEGDKILVDPTETLFSGALASEVATEPGRSSIESVKAFPNNVQVRINGSHDGGQIELMYEFVRLPQSNYQPRPEDDRVGFFSGVVQDYSTVGALSPRVRFINRWKLEKVDPTAAVSDVKEPIVWWIERSVPREYRSYVKDGILEWNKAFEKAGYRNAIEVRQQGDADNFDANDCRYNVFRWALGEDAGYAIAVMTANPRTGQMVCGRVVFHEALLRSQINQYSSTRGIPDADKLARGDTKSWLVDNADLIPFIDQDTPLPARITLSPKELQRRQRRERGLCKLQGRQLGALYSLAALHFNMINGKPLTGKVPIEFTGGFVKMIAMHEVGHCLGLRHNFRASTMLTQAQLNDKELVAKSGLSASVMDYVAPNLCIPGEETQGFYFTPTIGPYDYLAIEYGYKDTDTKGLNEVASRAAVPGNGFATDEDLHERHTDPRVQPWDLGDPLDFGVHQTRLLHATLPGLADRMVPVGESWSRALDGLGTLLGGFSRATMVACDHLSGWYLARDHRGDGEGVDPVQPLPPAKQRQALAFLTDTVLTASPAMFDADLLRKLGRSNYSDEFDRDAYVNPNAQIANIQVSAISSLLSGATLVSLQAQAAFRPQAAKGADVSLTPLEVYDAVVGSVFREVPKPGAPAKPVVLNPSQRIVQKALIRLLAARSTGRVGWQTIGFMLIEDTPTTDARALARPQLRKVGTGVAAMLKAGGLDAMTQAHYELLAEFIDNAVGAKAVFELN